MSFFTQHTNAWFVAKVRTLNMKNSAIAIKSKCVVFCDFNCNIRYVIYITRADKITKNDTFSMSSMKNHEDFDLILLIRIFK